jgi:hypothetical protein
MVGLIISAVLLALAILCLLGSIIALVMLRPILALILFIGFLVFALLTIGWLILWIIFKAITKI